MQLAGVLRKDKLLTAGVGLSYKDEVLHERELKKYLTPFSRAGLISDEGITAALARFKEVRGDSKTTSAEIGLAMTLTSEDISTLINKLPKELTDTFIWNRLVFIYGSEESFVPDFKKEWGDDLQKTFHKIVEMARAR